MSYFIIFGGVGKIQSVYLQKKKKAQREKMKILERNKLWRGERCWPQNSSEDRESPFCQVGGQARETPRGKVRHLTSCLLASGYPVTQTHLGPGFLAELRHDG